MFVLFFLDLSKAFDKVPHQPLLNKLRDLEVNAHILRWLENYLFNRSQYVVINGVSSSTSLAISGVPQGSVLGPLLFLVYVNDVAYQIYGRCLLSLFADDILMHLEISCAADFNTVQANLDSVSDWISDQHMDLNAKKCKYMVISRKRVPYWLDSDLNLMDSSLERVCTYKYLGIWLNDTLSWSHHIKEIYKKATRQIGMIYRRFYLVCSSNTLLNCYIFISAMFDLCWNMVLLCGIPSIP